MSFNQSVNYFRKKRGARLRRHIRQLSHSLGRTLDILDVGGRPDYWENVGLEGIRSITFLNQDDVEFGDRIETVPGVEFSFRIGDARQLAEFSDKSVDLVHSNSVIEHVGGWDDMAAMAREVVRVGGSGWIQTPAWEFPIEPHFHAPFVHWVGKPMGVRLLSLSRLRWCRDADLQVRRYQLDHVNLLAKRELKALFPNLQIYTERVILAKSYVVHWAGQRSSVAAAGQGSMDWAQAGRSTSTAAQAGFSGFV
ncbi:class I SAM-dependent methyltransferase [Tranquillimonas rosea]|uniref:class I SAM-dependent methyltransferase n=1 Tax=Tranquillimonas rosea TaxID=641238 RepID=UPI003BAD90C4